MTFEAAGALLGLLALPVLVWLHRRRREAAPRDLPSLLFVKDELEQNPPRRRLLDVDLLLALLGAAGLALAAAGPRLAVGAPVRVLRVVVSGGAPAVAFEAARTRALDALRAAADPRDEVEVVEVAGPGGRRPRPARLLDAALAGRASARFVLSDAPAPPVLPPGVAWIAIGRADVRNLGVVGAALVAEGDGRAVFAVVASASPAPERVRLALEGADGDSRSGEAFTLAPGATRSTTLALPGSWRRFALVLQDAEGGALGDAVPADDRVDFEEARFAVRFGDAVPAPYRRAVRAALDAALGEGVLREGNDEADLAVVAGEATASAGMVLRLFPLGDGPPQHADGGDDVTRDDPLVRDLSTRGVDLVYAPDALAAAEAPLLWREGSRAWPVVARAPGDAREVRFLPDPLRGAAAPADAPLWPLFVDNLVREVLGDAAEGAAGWRRRGLLDAATTQVGREATSLAGVGQDLARVAADRPPPALALRSVLLLLALAALGVLWGRTRRRRSPSLPVRSRA